MPRETKATLETEIRILLDENRRLREETWRLKEMNKVLATRQFDVDAFCRMHANAMEAIAHVVTDLRTIITKR